MIKYRNHFYRLASKEIMYHGTTQQVLDAVLAEREKETDRVYKESNVSLGGAYFTTKPVLAEFYARNAVRSTTDKGPPVVVRVKTIYPLLPDEDWVVAHMERNPDEYELSWPQYQEFFDALFQDYDDGSLSDHYAANYDQLNDEFGITYEDSLAWGGSVRQQQPLTKEQVISWYTVE